jgi:uncharacterized membrane protein HdeD (DUF308 family)
MMPQFMNEELQSAHEHWGLLTAVGIMLIILGMVAIFTPVIASGAAILLFGLVLLVGGAAAIIGGFHNRKSGGLAMYLLTGFLSMIAGWIILHNPAVSLATVTILIAVWLFISGIFRVVMAFTQPTGRGWAIFGGAVAAILGVMIFNNFPSSALWFVGLAVGIEMIFQGWAWLAIGMAAKSVPDATAA